MSQIDRDDLVRARLLLEILEAVHAERRNALVPRAQESARHALAGNWEALALTR